MYLPIQQEISLCSQQFLFIFADSCNDSPKILYRGQNSQGKVLRLLLSVGDIHKGSQEGYILANKVSVKLDPFPTSGINKVAMMKKAFPWHYVLSSLPRGNEIIRYHSPIVGM